MDKLRDELIDSIANMEEEKSLELVRTLVNNGYSPVEIVEVCRHGVEKVGKLYSEEHYYLSDLIMAEEIFRGIMEILQPLFEAPELRNGVKVVIGTIEEDIHDLGKNIVVNLLKSVGFDVYDLGVDVKPEQFIEKIIETGAQILGVSVVLTYSISYMKKLIRLLEEIDLRKNVKVVIGGYPVDERIKDYVGADYWENDASKVVDLIKEIAATLQK
jgi:methylmalonyl-CoA mutase cobalamin-binding domain/chain